MLINSNSRVLWVFKNMLECVDIPSFKAFSYLEIVFSKWFKIFLVLCSIINELNFKKTNEL